MYTDGGARGNPGPAGSAVVILEGGNTIGTLKKYLGDKITNNWAEYEALFLGLEKILEMKRNHDPLEVRMDSELVVKQMRGEYKIKDANLKISNQKIKELMKQFKKVDFVHVRREHNKEADALVNEAIDEALG